MPATTAHPAHTTPPAPAAGGDRRRWLRTLRRAATALAGLALAAAAVWGAGAWAEHHETEARRATLRSAAEMHALWLRGVTNQFAALPKVAGYQPTVTQLLQRPADAGLRAQANRYLEDIASRAGASALFVMDTQGRTLASSNWRSPESFVDQVYLRRPYFAAALAGRTGLFYGVGMTTGKPGLFIAEGLTADGRPDGPRIGVAVVKVALDTLAESWARSPDPVLLRDALGVSFLATYPAWRYHRTRALDPLEEAALRDSQAYGRQEALPPMPWQASAGEREGEQWVRARVDGQPRQFLALNMPLPDLGWTLTVMTNREEILQTRNQAAAMAALALALGLLAAQYWRLRERRYAEQRQARIELEHRVEERTHELREAHAFRHAMEDSLVVGMRARDLQGTIIYVNRALCEMTGYEEHELLGRQPPYPYWHPDDLDKHWADSNAALSGQAERSGFESRVRHKAGHDVITRVYTAPLIDADGVQRGWMSSVVDITGQKQDEARQRAQEAQLQRSARLAGLGEMASTLAHELNQPLMALSNFAAAAQALARQGQQALLLDSLGDIQAQARRASEIVKRIRGMVRPGRGAAQPFQIGALMADVLAGLSAEVQARQVRVRLDAPDTLPPLTADRLLIEQLLLNLLLNALQALEDQAPERRQIDLSADLVGGPTLARSLRVSVADHGAGVPEDVAPRLFDAFFTTKADGLGLGLKICRSIVESQGGTLAWRRRPGGGAVFEFSLPLPRAEGPLS